jgi:hypothetical protein
MTKLIPLGGTMQVVDMTTGRVEEKPSGMMLLPAAPGKCQVCAVDHAPEQPHNRDSLFYQMRFHGENGRWPVWSDALAHCAEPVRAAWESELRNRGVWKEPEFPAPQKHETPVPADALLQPGAELNVQAPDGGPDRPGKILAVVPKGVPVEHAIADQNGRTRPSIYTLNRRRSTLYVIEVTNADGTTAQATVTQRDFAKGLSGAQPRETTP